MQANFCNLRSGCEFPIPRLEDVLEIVHREKPRGLIVQFGGQTPGVKPIQEYVKDLW